MRTPIRIVSDGTVKGTTVYDAEGKPLPYVTGFTILGEVSDDLIRGSVEFDLIALDLTAEVDL